MFDISSCFDRRKGKGLFKEVFQPTQIVTLDHGKSYWRKSLSNLTDFGLTTKIKRDHLSSTASHKRINSPFDILMVAFGYCYGLNDSSLSLSVLLSGSAHIEEPDLNVLLCVLKDVLPSNRQL